jgi:hypothetical protein
MAVNLDQCLQAQMVCQTEVKPDRLPVVPATGWNVVRTVSEIEPGKFDPT